MAKAYGALSARASSAADRLVAKNEPTGKQGNAALTTKVRAEFNKVREETDISWEQWLAGHPDYGLGDNNQVYKK